MVAGVLMEITAMARRLVETVQCWVGHWAGGLLMAEIVAIYIFSGISGSKSADMATIGAVMKAPMRARGYPAAEFAAVLCASAAMSETVPPSLAMLILGSVTSLSIGALFVAGIVPAIVLAAALIAAVVLRAARRHGWDAGAPFRLRGALASLPPAIPALGVPVIVIGGIVGGLASPTEAGSFAVMYGLAAACLAVRSIGATGSTAAIRGATLTAGMILLTITYTDGGGTATAELALALMLAAARTIPLADATMRRGGFQAGVPPGCELAGQVLGLIGLGKLGRLMARYGAALGMAVLAWSQEPDCGGRSRGRRHLCPEGRTAGAVGCRQPASGALGPYPAAFSARPISRA